jgi:hypothetical protein
LPQAALWPTPSDASSLRALLADEDPAVRSLAVEALATLQEPEDVERIARLLTDESDGPPALGWNNIAVAIAWPQPVRTGSEDILRSWSQRKVKTYAWIALRFMTGQDFNVRTFTAWWPRNRDGRLCLWYWEEKLYRELAEIAATPFPSWEAKPGGMTYGDCLRQYRDDQSRRRAAVIQGVRTELEKLPPEVEAKVRLLALNQYSTALGADLDAPLMGPFDSLRLSRDRLLDLLDRRNLWADVNWDATHYNAMVTQLAGSAEKLFGREQVPRLRAVRARESGNLGWNGRAALFIGISRLLPPAQIGSLDDVNTRDGVLRDGIRNHEDVFVNGATARELVRVGVEQNWPFLEHEFFAEEKSNGIPDIRMSIVQELGAPPLTQEKRAALASLLLDKRYEPLWTSQSLGMSDDLYRQYAFMSVNAYAGREVLTTYDSQNLRSPATAEKTFVEVRRKVADVLLGHNGGFSATPK